MRAREFVTEAQGRTGTITRDVGLALPGLAGLVAGAEAGAVVAVEVLVEEHQLAPVRVGGEARLVAVAGTAAVLVVRVG